MPQCDTCQEYLDTWQELAQHILRLRSSHGAGLKWAQSFLTKAQLLNQKRDLPQRIALTEEQRDAKESCQRELSGLLTPVRVQCPMCTTISQSRIEQEFSQNPAAWKTSDNKFYILCPNCAK